jgi:hypothetical protein
MHPLPARVRSLFTLLAMLTSVAVPSTSTGRPTRAVRLTKRQREVSVESEATLTNRIRDTTYVDLGDQPPMANQGSSDPQSARIHQLIGYARAYGEWREGGRLAFYEWIVVQENDSVGSPLIPVLLLLMRLCRSTSAKTSAPHPVRRSRCEILSKETLERLSKWPGGLNFIHCSSDWTPVAKASPRETSHARARSDDW